MTDPFTCEWVEAFRANHHVVICVLDSELGDFSVDGSDDLVRFAFVTDLLNFFENIEKLCDSLPHGLLSICS